MLNTIPKVELNPKEYFDYIKSKKEVVTDEYLKNFYSVCQVELEKAMKSNQVSMLRKLAFTIDTIEREKKLLDLGITTFIYRDDILLYIQNVAKKVVKIIELERYPRSIPDEVANKVKELRDNKVFDEFYIVFTDYTDSIGQQVQAERRQYDPILFGTFLEASRTRWTAHDRFYYIADWEDEYCDLTLCKMISEMSKNNIEANHDICIPDVSLDTVRTYLNSLEEKSDTQYKLHKAKDSWFDKLNIFSRK